MKVANVLLPILLVPFLCSSAGAQVDFQAGRIFSSDVHEPTFVDLNGDSHQDVVMRIRERERLAVFLGNDRGELLRQANVSVPGIVLHSYALGIFEGDFPDLLVSTTSSGIPQTYKVHYFRGNGDGTFDLRRDFFVNRRAFNLTAGDFDGDQNLDFAYACFCNGGRNVRVRFGDGNGSFPVAQEAVIALQGEFGTAGIGAADFDGDGKTDLALRSSEGSQVVHVAIADDQGGFEPLRTFVLPETLASSRILTGDWNLDGNMDVLVEIPMRLLFGDGTGNLALGAFLGASTDRVACLAEFDGQSPIDLLVSEYAPVNGTGRLRLYLGDGSGFTTGPAYPTPRTFASTGAGDIDGDGIADIFASPVLHLSDGPLSHPFPARLPTPNGANFRSVVTGDFFGADGDPDVIALSGFFQPTTKVFPLVGDGAGEFTALPEFTVPGLPRSAGAADVNDDGLLDAVIVSDRIVTLVNADEGGGFEVRVTQDFGANADSSALGDFDEDGYLDVCSTNLGVNEIILAFGDGTGRFPEIVRYGISGVQHRSVAAGDLDRDGHLDLVVAKRVASGEVHVLLGRGNGTFEFGPVIPVEEEPDGLAIADLNGDGWPDLAVGNRETDELHLLMGDGTGAFVRSSVLPLDGGSLQIVARDLLGNGVQDLINLGDDVVVVLEGNGDATFRERRFLTPAAVWATVDDLDRDGTGDLIVSTRDRNGSEGISTDAFVSVYFNRSRTRRNASRGTIRARNGDPVDVLLVNGGSGAGRDRVVEIDPFSLLTLTAQGPPSNPPGPAPFVVYGWVGAPDDKSRKKRKPRPIPLHRTLDTTLRASFVRSGSVC